MNEERSKHVRQFAYSTKKQEKKTKKRQTKKTKTQNKKYI